MSRDYKTCLKDIVEAIGKIQKHASKISQEAFLSESMTSEPEYVNRKLGIIGEAASKIPQNIRKQYPSLEWKKIIGLRNIIIHEYDKIDRQTIWNIIKTDLPILEEKINQILKELEEM